MFSMDLAMTIKRLYEREKMSIRQISQKTGCSRNTVSKYINGGEVGYHTEKKRLSPKQDKVRPLIESWYKEDQKSHYKQRRTAQKMYNDLKSQYEMDISYSTVKAVLLEFKKISREVFLPRYHEPGRCCEFDFGEFQIDISGEKIKVNLHGFQFPCSNEIFGYISLRQTQEEMFEGHKQAFTHFERASEKSW